MGERFHDKQRKGRERAQKRFPQGPSRGQFMAPRKPENAKKIGP